MKQILLCGIALLFFVNDVIAQDTQINGSVLDGVDKIKLAQASVSLLQAKDSILVKFTRATADGSFKFNDIFNGSYLLLITYPNYADYVENFEITESNKSKDFGSINMVLKSRLLQEVIVKGEVSAIKIKGDTTEFNAGSYKVQPNAKVEDLLKQLPGIQIDKDGKITAQGETVTRVLVDGEEFFGDDPTLVTKNIRSDMVDKVQLYDDKTETAKFTGIDDGQKSKTINLKLKEDKKKGLFGKLDAGSGNSDFYSTQALFNAFDNKKKLALYSTIGNTKRTGLDWQSSQKFGLMGGNIEIGDDGGISVYFGGEDQFSNENFGGEGIPSVVNTGIHVENKWKDDKHAINFDYKFGRLANNGFRTDLSQNNLPGNFLTNNSNRNFDDLLSQHKLNGAYQLKIDTSSNLKITFDNTLKNNENMGITTVSGFVDNGNLLNDGITSFNDNRNDNRLNTSLLYGKKFKKSGRTLTFRFNQSYFKTISDGLLTSTNNFYNQTTAALDSTAVVNQLKENNQDGESYKTSFTFTEKITKTIAITTNYDFAYNVVTSDLKSFNANSNGQYTDFDTRFSNELDYKVTTNQGGLSFNYKKNKSGIILGSKVALARLNQNNLITNVRFAREFVNYLPTANYEYKFSKQSSLRFGYNGNTSQPTVGQLQPVLNNYDPLNLTIGNPDLKPSFANNFNINYNSYKVLTGRGIWFYSSFNFTNNAIVSDRSTDEAGKSIFRYVNIKSNNPSRFYVSGSYNIKLGKSKFNLSSGLSVNGNTFYNIANTQLNKGESYNISPRFSISSYEDKYTMYVSFEPGYRINNSSLQPLQNSNGTIFNSDGEFFYKLPKKVSISVNYRYEFQEKTTSFNTNFDRLIINSSLSKTFLKKDNLKFSVSGNDLLNQNVGFRRSAYGNVINQSSFNNIQRYFLFSLVWDFSKFGKLAK